MGPKVTDPMVDRSEIDADVTQLPLSLCCCTHAERFDGRRADALMRRHTLLARFLIVLACSVGLLRRADAGSPTDLTGFWKGDCSAPFGLQIKPTGNGLYSVSFCGPGGCFEPGQWTPNTRIEGDRKYEVVSPRELRMRTGDGFVSYVKCRDDPTWTVESAVPPQPEDRPDCSLRSPSKGRGVLIAWVTTVRKTTQLGQGTQSHTTVVEPVRPLAVLQDAALEPALRPEIYKGQRFWRVLAPTARPARLRSAGAFLDRMNEDHCVYFGTFEKASPPLWTLLSSEPLPGVFRAPTENETLRFSQLNNSCVEQGDYPEDRMPACVRPRLLAITDINKNGRPEYWATEPYRWDTGLTVWEEENGKLIPLLELCVGCSD